MWFAEVFADLLLFFEDLKFWKNKRARRKFEKENNLPKKPMWLYPSQKIEIFALLVITTLVVLIYFLFSRNIEEKRTIEKLATIENLLEAEKKKFKAYPADLKMVIRNNPLHKKLLTDAWGNAFYYKPSENGVNFVVISKGKDGELNTDDDIKL